MSGSTSFTLPTPPAPTVDGSGIHAPVFNDYLAYLFTCYQAVYGADVYLGNDSQDGQLLILFATVLADQSAACVAAYNAFSPSTAQGVGLSSMVKINGLARELPSYSTATLNVVGVGGLVLNNALASDGTYYWAIPAGSVIPPSGLLVVTATCTTLGSISAAPAAINTIQTPTAGWQTVTNPLSATPGEPVETDLGLRLRQTASTMIASHTIVDGIVGAILALPGVVSCVPYENDSNATSDIGLPANSLTLAIDGGDLGSIANTIFTMKTPGVVTYGTTTQTVIDSYGVPHIISWYQVVKVPISLVITVNALTGYSNAVGLEIVRAVVAFINGLASGQIVRMPRLWVPAQLMGPYATGLASPSDPSTFELVSVQISRDGFPPAAADVPISFFEQATCSLSLATILVAAS